MKDAVDNLWAERNKVREGYSDALDLFMDLRMLQKEIDEVLKEIRQEATEQGAEYHGQTYRGRKIEIRTSGARWVFDDCEKVAQAKLLLKEAQEFHKVLSGVVVNGETGEVYEPAYKKPGRDTLFIS